MTPARVAVLSFLAHQTYPVGIEQIQHAQKEVNTVTLYRMMADFVKRGLVTTNDMGRGHKEYEFAKRAHHHHLICETCGSIEDVYPCATTCVFEQAILASSKQFKRLTGQTAAFYGVCANCP